MLFLLAPTIARVADRYRLDPGDVVEAVLDGLGTGTYPVLTAKAVWFLVRPIREREQAHRTRTAPLPDFSVPSASIPIEARLTLREVETRAALLSPEEQDLLDALLATENVTEAARALGVSPRTAERHVAAIRAKLKGE